jgi:acetone carboxylase gamma subunit
MAKRKEKELPRKETDWKEVDRIIDEMKDKSVFEVFLALRGKVHWNLNLEELRED